MAHGSYTVPPISPDPNTAARALFAGLPRRYELLAEVLSFGQNGRWQRAAVDRVTQRRPTRILDLATGTTRVARLLAERNNSTVVGVDLSAEMLRQGVATVTAAGLENRIRLVTGRAEQLPFADGTFDGATFSYLLRYVANPAATLDEIARVVAPGSTVASLEFHLPPALPWRVLWWIYTRGVLPIAGFVTGGIHWFRVGRFLGPSISEHYRQYPLAWTLEAWRRAGFVDVDARLMSLGGGVVIWGTRADG